MLLLEPSESQYDVRFEVLGFPVRIAWTFWLGALIFGHGFCQGIDDYLFLNDSSPGMFALLLTWIACLFVSILIHELGHALAFRQFGLESSIVLYHFGGLAIPRGPVMSSRSPGQLTEKQEMWIAAAGPLLQIVTGLLMAGGLVFAGYGLERAMDEWQYPWMPFGLGEIEFLNSGEPINNPILFALVAFYVYPSVMWALLNLLPVWPLDGGRIMRSLMLIFGGRTEQTIWVSLITAGAMAIYGFTNGMTFMGILFLSLGITNYQMLQQSGGWRF